MIIFSLKNFVKFINSKIKENIHLNFSQKIFIFLKQISIVLEEFLTHKILFYFSKSLVLIIEILIN